ncbi:MAG: tetratricopeptide repeat protein [Prosthecobacter sp.]|nr:tetratricopeptide repeat protein [Prosthecobacter sp.]
MGPIGAGPAPSSTSSTALPDMTVKEMVDVAKQVRSFGDMQGALETLNKIDLRYPNDPSVLAEMAQCYEQMGLSDKATALWRRLEAMSPEQAAGYHDLAARRLSAGPAMVLSKSSPMGIGAADATKVLSLGACLATRDSTVVNGEKVVLRIPVLRQGNGAVDPSQVDIDVYFFDRVNGEKVAQTIADDPVTAWGAPPVDWSGIGEEPLNVTYFLPELTPGEIQAHGRRSYHGYLVKLYYQHKLQDTAAEPRDLLDYGSNVPQAGAGTGNPLLPPVTN